MTFEYKPNFPLKSLLIGWILEVLFVLYRLISGPSFFPVFLWSVFFFVGATSKFALDEAVNWVHGARATPPMGTLREAKEDL